MNTKIGTVTSTEIKRNVNDKINDREGKQWGHLSNLSLRALLVLYVYMLVKIILLKFHSVDLAFLWGRLMSGLQQPSLLSQWLDTGNLVPFREISRSLHSLNDHNLYNLLGNVAIFMPLGILLGLMFNHEGMSGLKIGGYAFFLSLGLETAQLLFMIGQFDVDDILLNTLGGCLGFIIYRIMIVPFLRTSS
ncbi:VanZ family protein [Paenibacillus paeoniae]|uniref:VanZ family protein n=1 Tax=Paenibacillus paeoniae TaxID=2292705 RepID=A0A371PGR6_9BACL|nr:VanZ family protein [Paenibacillus paeoniae]REK75157.1 VanZ family protein [Paenibacillus paeoniae]